MTPTDRLDEIVRTARANNKTQKGIAAAIKSAVGTDKELLDALGVRAQKIKAADKKRETCPMVMTIGKQKYAPWDMVTEGSSGEKMTLAAAIVKQTADGFRGETYVKRELDRIFLKQWPEGPQLP